MKYRGGYKYQLAANEKFKTSFRPPRNIITPRIELNKGGILLVREGYSYDGPSGPVIDRKTNMRGAACHDALYQLMRMKNLNFKDWRKADLEFGKCLKEDGAWPITVMIDMLGLKIARGSAAHPRNRKKVHTAP